MATGYDDYGKVDYTKAWEDALGNANYSELSQIAAARAAKTALPDYAQYANDATQQAMDAYLQRMAPTSAPTMPKMSYGEFSTNNGYDQIAAQQKAAYDAYMKGFDADAQLQTQRVNSAADKAAQEAYISYMLSKKALPQQLSAAGYTGGLADTHRVGLETNLQNNQATGQIERARAIEDIENALRNAKLTTSLESAKEQAGIARDAVGAFNQYTMSQAQMANSDYWSGVNQQNYLGERAYNAGRDQIGDAWDEKSWAWQEAQDAYNKSQTTRDQAKGIADSLLQIGQMPSAEQLAAAGYTAEQAQQLAGYWAQQIGYGNTEQELGIQAKQQALAGGGSSGGGSGGGGTGGGSSGSTGTGGLSDAVIAAKQAVATMNSPEEVYSYAERQVNDGILTPEEAMSLYQTSLASAGAPTTYEGFMTATGGTVDIPTKTTFDTLKKEGLFNEYATYQSYLEWQYAKYRGLQ